MCRSDFCWARPSNPFEAVTCPQQVPRSVAGHPLRGLSGGVRGGHGAALRGAAPDRPRTGARRRLPSDSWWVTRVTGVGCDPLLCCEASAWPEHGSAGTKGHLMDVEVVDVGAVREEWRPGGEARRQGDAALVLYGAPLPPSTCVTSKSQHHSGHNEQQNKGEDTFFLEC